MSASVARVARSRARGAVLAALPALVAVVVIVTAGSGAAAREETTAVPAPFRDVTEAALTPTVYQSFTRRNGVALLDFDRDGWLDIFLDSVKGKPSFLYRNNRDGTFRDVAAEARVRDTGGNGRGVAAADFNGDGWTDLYIGQAGALDDGLDYRSGGDQGNINRLFLNRPGPQRTRLFQDVTEVAGVGDPRSASTVGVGDVNLDGRLDIYVANLGDEEFRRFESVDPTVPHNNHRNTLLLNMGNDGAGVPRFKDVTKAAGVEGPAEKNRDLNGEPIDTFDPDFVDEQGNLVGDKPGNQTHAALFTDVDGDRDADLFTGDDFGTLTLYRNDGDTNGDGVPDFTDVSRLIPSLNKVGNWMGFADADIDGDGDLDYFVTNMGSQVVRREAGFNKFDLQRFTWGNRMLALLRNDGNRRLPGAGTIPDLADVTSVTRVTPSAAMPPSVTDARNVHPLMEPVASLQAYEFGFGTTFFDLENDGDPDLYWLGDTGGIGAAGNVGIARVFYNSGRLLANDAGQGFTDVTAEAQAITIRDFPYDRIGQPGFDALQFIEEHHLGNTALAAGDLNNDGAVDLVAVTEGTATRPGPLFILMNGNRGNDWVKVQTVGTRSNRDGIGARVTLSAGGDGGPMFAEQVRQVKVGSSYLATEAKDLVFGLGRGARDLTLRVEWPSGRVDVYDDVQPNSVFVAREGAGEPGR